MSERWDVGRALALAALFRLLQGAGRACAAPFLPLYLRLLGLSAPLAGAAAGARHLAALAVPLCRPRGRGGRRLLLMGSALGSAGAGLLLTLIPPAGPAGCSHGRQHGLPAAVPSGLPAAPPATVPSTLRITVPSTVPSPVPSRGTSGYTALSSSALPDTRAEPKGAGRTTADALAASRKPALGSSAFQGGLGTANAQGNGRGVGEGDTKGKGSLDGPSGWAVKATDQETQEPSYGPPFPGLEEKVLGSAATDLTDNAEQSLYAAGSNEPPLFKTTLPTVGGTSTSENLSHTQDVNFAAAQSIFQDREHQVFLMVLGAVVLWELLATSLEWTVDESLYEYLDLVDATDRSERLWVWSSLGAAAGACGVSVLVDHLDCSLGGSIPRLAVHLYAYAVLGTLSLLVALFLPTRVPGKRAPGPAKALSVLRGDGRALLFAATAFLAGAAGSAAHDFLPWQLQDQGGGELLVGLWVAAGPLAELGLAPFKGKLLRTVARGRMAAASLSLLAGQLLCYSALRAPWAALPVQGLSAFGSGALWWVLEGTAGDIATPGTERSLRAVLRALCWGGGASLGSFGGGFVVQRFGLPVLFRASCVGLGLWLVFFVVVQSKLPRQRKINYSRLLAADSSELSDSEEENEKDWLVKAMEDESFNRSWIQQHGIR